MGKSTLIKSVVKATSSKNNNLKIIEVARDDIGQMDSLLKTIKNLIKNLLFFVMIFHSMIMKQVINH